MSLAGKKILITGGAGFIGSNLAEHFVKQNDVVVLDNLSTGHLQNIEHLIGLSNFQFIEGDIRDLATCLNHSKDVDLIYHQAALGSVPRSINDPITTNQVNIDGFLNMLNAAREQKVERFIYAASSSTYGDSKALPKVEENIGKPLSPYAVTKLVNELYADVFYKLYETKVIGLRYFNVFGLRQDPNGAYAAAIPKFINKFASGEAPTIHGDGLQSRDFTHVDNVILANELAGTTTNPDAFGEVFNVACGKAVVLTDLVSTLKEELAQFDSSVSKVGVVNGPERIGDIKHSLASIDKISRILGYQPVTHFNEGIKKTINWYWENR
ncbi:SDR family oxidoreductase [Parvicella tangerina]|uniref:UDP-N-acetylglucosamine 4-epimerase n=1 Tax=Parvicella tangerina TaxID=2829795 RepID=A0A916JPX6_9FLAO|nr:SDR family oxidoreductase [Parvicella tangerina]CAG5085289.1 UDP-N-acetylglucosamine 4-epimerase [Parvicella tangerina]